MKTLLQRKQELNEETVMLNSLLSDIEAKIEIYSSMDMVRVEELTVIKTYIEATFLDVLTESNNLWLESIKSA